MALLARGSAPPVAYGYGDVTGPWPRRIAFSPPRDTVGREVAR